MFTKEVTPADFAAFHGEVVHPVMGTFSLSRDFEWTSRLFFLDMRDEDEEGVGTFVHVQHHAPARAGEMIHYTATVTKIEGNELTCALEAYVGDRLIATGATGQKMLKKEWLTRNFGSAPPHGKEGPVSTTGKHP